MDNLNTHNEKTIKKHLGEKRGQQVIDRLKIHYTPPHASWLNAAEIEIGVLSKMVLSKRIGDKKELKKQVGLYVRSRNKMKAKINWKFTKQKAHKTFNICN